MADALRAMPHLRSLSLCSHYSDTEIMTGHIPVVGVVLQGCSAQLTSLVCNGIIVEDDQPPQQLGRLSAALMRLTSLQVLQVPGLAHTYVGTCAKDQHAVAAAAAAVATVLLEGSPPSSPHGAGCWAWLRGKKTLVNILVCCPQDLVLSLSGAMFEPPDTACVAIRCRQGTCTSAAEVFAPRK